MKISVPNIPQSILSAASSSRNIPDSLEVAIQKVSQFLRPGNATMLTGAGVSVDSGIRAYRGPDGRYVNPNYRPIFHHELIEDSEKGQYFRRRYWCRSYLGYPPVARARPNPTHYAISALHYAGHIKHLITQNVDGLHLHASSSLWSEEDRASRILELHGTLHKVHCRWKHTTPRDIFQNLLSDSNPRWKQFMDDMEASGTQPRTNPDGDVELQGASYEDFVVPLCEACLQEGRHERILKPALTFFGDSVSNDIKDKSYKNIEESDRLILVGTTLATYSAFRLFKHAVELSKPVLLLNVGPTRADPFVGHPEHGSLVSKVEWRAGEVLKPVAKLLIDPLGSDGVELQRLLSSGVVTPIETGDDDMAPRTAG